MAAITGQADQFDIGRVIEQTFGALARNFVPFFLFSLVLTGIPQGLIGLGQFELRAEVMGRAVAAPSFAPLGWMAAGWLVSIVTSMLLQAVIVIGTVADLNGERATIAESLSKGLRFVLPLLAISVLMGIALIFGFLLLFVPGLILWTIWAVVVPAEVVERTGVFRAFERSAELTRGRRWSVFALFVIYLLLGWMLGMVGMTVKFALLGGIGALPTAAMFSVPYLVVNTLTRSLSAVISAVGVSVLYFQLRASREGVTPTQLAAVFD